MSKPTVSIESLLADLHASDFRVRCDAARRLGQTRDPRAVDALMSDLQDTDWRVRRNAAQALGAARDRRAVEPLIHALQDRVMTVRQRAAVALGRIKDSRAIVPLLETLKTDNWHLYKDTLNAALKFGSASIPAIAAALRDADQHHAIPLIDLLGAIGHSDALDPLIARLQDADSIVRLHTAGALGMLRDARAVESLIKALSDTPVPVQSVIVRALGQLGDKQVVAPLLHLLHDHELYGPYTDLYAAITEVLQILGGIWKHSSTVTRSGIALMNGEEMQTMNRIVRTVENLSNAIPLEKNRAAELLNLGRNNIQKIDAVKSAVPQEVDTLITMLNADADLTRIAAAVSLPWYGDRRALEPLRRVGDDPDPSVQMAAIWAAETLEKLLIYLRQRP